MNLTMGSSSGFEPPSSSRRQYRSKVSWLLLTAVTLALGFQFILLPRYVYQISPSSIALSKHQLDLLDAKLDQCTKQQKPLIQYPITAAGSRENPRWNQSSGQNETVVLKNATLFDGEEWVGHKVDIVLKKGIVESVSPAGSSEIWGKDARVFELEGGYVTPGLVDMHSHHCKFLNRQCVTRFGTFKAHYFIQSVHVSN